MTVLYDGGSPRVNRLRDTMDSPCSRISPPSLGLCAPLPGPEHHVSRLRARSCSTIPLTCEPLPADASPTSLSPGYVANSDPDENLEEDPKEDHADYPADGGDDDDEPSDDDDDDDDTDDEDEEPDSL
ncbi:hypothetical protein Tco_0981414 [Tanacetum coccineum]